MLYRKTRETGFWLVFEQATTWDRRRIDLSLPKPSKPTAYPDKQFFSSTAKLRDVRTITVCRSWRHFLKEGIVGMLLTYADGCQRSIGQIRLDCMGAPLTVTSGKIWLGCDKSENEPLPEGFWLRTNKIKWVGVDTPLQDEKWEYFEVPLTGSLEWQSYKNWDYYYHSVYHHESSELQDEMDEVLAREAASGELAPRVVKTFSVDV
jgi:hypothetical protein